MSGNNTDWTSGNPNAPQAQQVAFLQGGEAMSQGILFTAGSHTIGFQAAQRGNVVQANQIVKVLIDGVQVGGTFTPASTAYASFTTDPFTVTAGLHTVTFQTTVTTDSTAFLDAITIS